MNLPSSLDLGDDDETPIPIPNVSGMILSKVWKRQDNNFPTVLIILLLLKFDMDLIWTDTILRSSNIVKCTW